MKRCRASAAFSFLLLTLLFTGVASFVSAESRDEGPKLLSDLDRESNPVKKAKIEVKLARLRLSEAIGAYSDGHYDEFWKLLKVYEEFMNKAWSDLQASGRVASKKSDGFKQLDIGLRESRRDLEDLETRITFDERQEVKKTLARMEDVHNQVLKALFPQALGKKKKAEPSGEPPEEKK